MTNKEALNILDNQIGYDCELVAEAKKKLSGLVEFIDTELPILINDSLKGIEVNYKLAVENANKPHNMEHCICYNNAIENTKFKTLNDIYRRTK